MIFKSQSLCSSFQPMQGTSICLLLWIGAENRVEKGRWSQSPSCPLEVRGVFQKCPVDDKQELCIASRSKNIHSPRTQVSSQTIQGTIKMLPLRSTCQVLAPPPTPTSLALSIEHKTDKKNRNAEKVCSSEHQRVDLQPTNGI